MRIINRQIYNEAFSIFKALYGKNAQFRDGQYEAIEATLLNRRTLVVQRTGWGKSMVYFTYTKLLRGRGAGVTFVVSPLLVLMQNQIEAAERMGLRCEALNSKTKDRREEILQEIKDETVDLVLVTPETLFTDDVQAALPKMRIGLFVIDEAHCISDWGHDFRLEYGRLKEVLRTLPSNVPVLATTATANDRVVADLKKQMGEQVFVSRGPLTRDSLYIQVVQLQKKAERYAWIAENITKMPGCGIIYCLTQRDCDYMADYLQKNGISALSYYSRDGEEEEKNRIAEDALKHNQIKAIVATIKLGMGYDKEDISFVIHFQMPANIVSYYQQIGRAGRNIDRAYVILMSGQEDEDILNYFIETAFPTKEETEEIVDCIREHEGMSRRGLEACLNLKGKRIDNALKFLQNDGFVYKDGSKFYVSPKVFVYEIINRHLQWELLVKHSFGKKVDLRELEPYVARYVKAVSACGVSTNYSCDGNRPEQDCIIVRADYPFDIWHGLICKYLIPCEYGVSFNEKGCWFFSPITKYNHYLLLNQAAEFLYNKRIWIREKKKEACAVITTSRLKHMPENELETLFIERIESVFRDHSSD